MNSRQIEQIAVNAVKDIFLQSEIFNPCIPDNVAPSGKTGARPGYRKFQNLIHLH